MTKNDVAYTASGSVPLDHLNAVVRLLSGIVGYSYSDWDKDAIWYGAPETNDETGAAFEYRIEGEAVLDLTFRRQRVVRAVTITVSGDNADLVARCQTVIDVLRDFDASKPFAGLQTVISKTFATNTYPGDDNLLSCHPLHFEVCDECQETFTNFAGRKWESIFTDAWTPPHGYAHEAFLGHDARFYFFPAYLASHLMRRLSGLRSGLRIPRSYERFSASHAQLIEIVEEITSMDTDGFLSKDYI